jgi:nucleotide-binding universal stress UspA family protein
MEDGRTGREQEEGMTIKRMLCASDFSPASRPALRLAQELARALKARLILFHAYEPSVPIANGGYLPPSVMQQMLTGTRDAAAQSLKRLASKHVKGGRISTLLAQGPAAPAIVRAAKRNRIDLVVMGTHGRTGVRRLLMGSVADRVIRTATCPVLVVGGRH